MSYQFPYWLNKNEFMLIGNLMKNDINFSMFVIKNTEDSRNKKELINLIKNIQGQEL
jgi:hypothetical protein